MAYRNMYGSCIVEESMACRVEKKREPCKVRGEAVLFLSVSSMKYIFG